MLSHSLHPRQNARPSPPAARRSTPANPKPSLSPTRRHNLPAPRSNHDPNPPGHPQRQEARRAPPYPRRRPSTSRLSASPPFHPSQKLPKPAPPSKKTPNHNPRHRPSLNSDDFDLSVDALNGMPG